MTNQTNGQVNERGRHMKKFKILALFVGLLGITTLSLDAYARGRMYHPTLGRFMQRDVLGYVDGMSLYQYTRSNPVVATDPSGGCQTQNPQTGKTMTLFAPDIKVVTPGRATGDCGGAKYVIQWVLPQAQKGERGWIIQKITYDVNVTDVKGQNKVPQDMQRLHQKPFWEAWSFVPNGTIYRGYPGGPPIGQDGFIQPNFGDCTKGTVRITGEAKGVTNYPLPSTFAPGNVASAGALPSTFSPPGSGPNTWEAPPGWDQFRGKAHNMTVTWDCTVTPKVKTKVTTTP